MMDLKVKKLDPNAVLPKYAHEGDAGLDLIALTTDQHSNGDYIEYGTGLAVEIPEGFVGLIFPRSSISNKDLMLTNCVGVIDSGYRGEIKFRFKPAIANNGQNKFGIRSGYRYNLGEKIGQLLIIPYPKINVVEVSELASSERGEKGFGSSS
jgi:dUTP diphosphatase